MATKIKLVSLALLVVTISGKSQQIWSYSEINGIVSIETELFTGVSGAWEEVEGRNAYPIEKQGLGHQWGEELFCRPNSFSSLHGVVKISDRNTHIPRAKVNENAIILAMNAENEYASVFLYDKGDIMPDMAAPGRRASLFTGRTNLRPSGWELYRDVVLWSSSKGKTLLYIGGGIQPNENDLHTLEQLKKWGYEVEYKSEHDAKPQSTLGKSVVIISESVEAKSVGSTYRDTETGVVVCEPYILDGMGMNVREEEWTAGPMQKGNAMLTRKTGTNQFLSYSIYFTSPGDYHVSILGQSAGNYPVEVPYLFSSEVTPESMENTGSATFNEKLAWSKGNELISIKDEGWYSFQFFRGKSHIADDSRYPGFRLDKIVLSKSSVIPDADGPVITLHCSMAEIPDQHLQYLPFLPKQIWKVADGFAVIEAEDIDHNPAWGFKTDIEDYTGNGYLLWEGSDMTQSIEGLWGNDDYTRIRQGPQEEMLILRVFITEPGDYSVDARNWHIHEDGDNDAWVNIVGFRPDIQGATDECIRRMGDSLNDGPIFSWLDWGVLKFHLDYGINNIYIGGRSPGFGIDRVAIYKDGNEPAKTKALNILTPVSELLPVE